MESQDSFSILKAYQAPSPYYNFKKNVFTQTIYTSFNASYDYTNYDLIGFYKKDLAFLEDQEFNALLEDAHPNRVKELTEHRRSIQAALKAIRLNKVDYKILLETKNYIYFVRSDIY